MIEDNFKRVTEFLFQGGKYSTKELALKFDTSPRTIQNYIKRLEHTGIEKEGTKYFIPLEYHNLEIHENVQVSVAMMIALYKQAIPELKESVTYNFKEPPKELDAFVFDIDFETIENEHLFNQIVSTILKKVAINFKYKSKNAKVSEKNTFPLKASNLDGYWYLIAYDLEDEKIKTYYIKHIEELTLHVESFLDTTQTQELNKIAQKIDSPWFNSKKQTVILKATNEAMKYLKREKSNSKLKILQNSNDELLLEMSYYSNTEVLIFVKRWLPHVMIVSNNKLHHFAYISVGVCSQRSHKATLDKGIQYQKVYP